MELLNARTVMSRWRKGSPEEVVPQATHPEAKREATCTNGGPEGPPFVVFVAAARD
jgi:hypothetical protein